MMLQQAGSVQLLCLTANSGVPLFTRRASKVHMFRVGQGMVLASCETDCGGSVVWREFQDSMMLIAVSSGGQAQQGDGSGAGEGDLHLRFLLENIWNCMVLVQDLLQEALDGFTQAADSGSSGWRQNPQRSLTGSVSCDAPVFLSQGSPTVAHCLLRLQLPPGVDVCVLCGPSPTMHRAESELVGRFWSPLVEALRGRLAVGERCLLGSVILCPDILALLLINRVPSLSPPCEDNHH
ncbi:unnamed protein product [Coregonus sp. 'balchen']|nr:unnamed protein product [Coregonus sp. 'balchen']